MILYTVVKKGKWSCDCGGIFSTLEEAYETLKNFIKNDRDDYHTYHIIPYELNKKRKQITECGQSLNVGEIEIPTPLITLTRRGTDIFETGDCCQYKS